MRFLRAASEASYPSGSSIDTEWIRVCVNECGRTLLYATDGYVLFICDTGIQNESVCGKDFSLHRSAFSGAQIRSKRGDVLDLVITSEEKSKTDYAFRDKSKFLYLPHLFDGKSYDQGVSSGLGCLNFSGVTMRKVCYSASRIKPNPQLKLIPEKVVRSDADDEPFLLRLMGEEAYFLVSQSENFECSVFDQVRDIFVK